MQYGRLLLSVGLVVVPRLVAATDLGPLDVLEPYGTAIKATSYLFGAGLVAWRGVHAIRAYRNRDNEGLGAVIEEVVAMGIAGVVMGVVVPALIDPIVALGATP